MFFSGLETAIEGDCCFLDDDFCVICVLSRAAHFYPAARQSTDHCQNSDICHTTVATETKAKYKNENARIEETRIER